MTRLYKRNGVYYLDFVQNGRRKRKSLGTSDLRSARRIRKEIESQLDGPRLEEAFPSDITLGDYIAEYLDWAKHNKAATTLTIDKVKLNQLQTFLGKQTRLCSVTPEQIEAYRAKRLGEVSPKTVQGDLIAIRAFFNRAVATGKLKQSPFRGIRMPRVAKNPPRFLDDDQVNAFLGAARKHKIEDICAAMLYAGLRKNEVCWLEWQDIDFRRGVITLRNKEDFTLKNYETRTIPLHKRLKEILRPRKQETGYCFRPDVEAQDAKGRTKRYWGAPRN